MPFRKERHFLMEKNYCENCKFYVKYYTLFNGTRLQYTGCGHCKHDKLINKKISRKTIYNKLPCNFWEQAENKEPEVKEKLENNIRDIKIRLDEIALILNRK